jgi:DivIVA domain-containing protein
MFVAFLACLVGLVAVLVALAHDEPLPTRRILAAPRRTVLAPADVVRTDFPRVWRGYDPATVETHLRAVARAWSSLPETSPYEPDEIPPTPPPSPVLEDLHPIADAEALRAHAALEILRAHEDRRAPRYPGSGSGAQPPAHF